jgi:hypothetical protein
MHPHTFALFTINNVFMSFTKPQKRGLSNGFPSPHPTIRELPVQKATNTTGEVKWCTI